MPASVAVAGRRTRRARLRRRLAVGGLALALLPVGLAQLATTVVEPTRAGEVVLPVEIATTLVAVEPDDAGPLVARLVAGRAPLAGLPVDFVTSSGVTICQAVETDATGHASCNPSAVTASPSWRAVFDGQDALLGSSDGATMPRMSTTDRETLPPASPSTEGAADAATR